MNLTDIWFSRLRFDREGGRRGLCASQHTSNKAPRCNFLSIYMYHKGQRRPSRLIDTFTTGIHPKLFLEFTYGSNHKTNDLLKAFPISFEGRLTAAVLEVLLIDGFVHRTQRLVACNILQLLVFAAAAVVAEIATVVMTEQQVLPIPSQYEGVTEVGVVVHSLHNHKASSQASYQKTGQIDLSVHWLEIEEVEVAMEATYQMKFVSGWIGTWIACLKLVVQEAQLSLVAVVKD